MLHWKKYKESMAVRNIVRQWNEATEGYSYRFKGGDIFLRLVNFFSFYKKTLYFVNNYIFSLLFQKNSVPLRYENDSKDI